MRRLKYLIPALAAVVILTAVFYPSVLAQVSSRADTTQVAPTATRTQPSAPQQQEKRIVDFEADIMRPIKVGDSSALNLLGNVVIHHNGAVITCDSAVRYSDKRMDCYKRVVINQGTTYVYGDRAEYNGEINIARVYSPIIKVVDEDAVLYTYRFEFNTLDKIGMFSEGGTMSQQDNLFEANKGYYYIDNKDLIGVGNVEISNPDYRLISDSISYNLGTKIASLFTKTYIWNNKGEILSAEEGEYFQNTAEYKFTKNSYIITADQEIWADTLDYYSEREDAVARSNVQIRDEQQKVMAFGDYAEYWGKFQNAMLTKMPSLVSFDPEQDSLYMSSDTVFLYTIGKDEKFVGRIDPETFRSVSQNLPDSLSADSLIIESASRMETQNATSTANQSFGNNMPTNVLSGADQDLPISEHNVIADSLINQTEAEEFLENADSVLLADSTLSEELPTKQEIRAQKAEERRLKAEEKAKQIEAKRAARAELQAAAQAQREERRQQKRQARLDARVNRKAAKQKEIESTLNQIDSLSANLDSLAVLNGIDSLGLKLDSLRSDSTLMRLDSLDITNMVEDSLTTEDEDTLQRIIVGYYNVRIYRNDMQAVCDSLIGFSLDSTMHLHVDPVLWSQGSQIVSEVVDIYSKNDQLYKAVFSGGMPIMASEVYEGDSTMYNQVQGRTIEAYFRDNDVYKADVVSNAQNIYYMVDEKTGELNGFVTVQCADITLFLTNRQMENIVWRGSPVYAIYPMDQIPANVPLRLDGFVWKSNLKPELKDVFTRYIRPSERSFYREELSEPQFPLTDKINKDREDKIRRRVWTERNDRLSQEAIDFVKEVSNR